MKGSLLRLGLLLVVAALLFPALKHVVRDVSDDPLEEWADRLMMGGFVCLGIALILGLMEKAGVRVSGQRCEDCKRPIQHGKRYCREHFMKRVEEARAKYHGQSGMGV